MERFDTLTEYDLDLDILIGEVSYYVEKTIDQDHYEEFDMTIADTVAAARMVESHFGTVIQEIGEHSDFPLEKCLEIRDRHNLAFHWWPEFVKQVIYLHITNRTDDLWIPNLGVSRLGPKDGLLIFFDW
jgi:hypothetical protein